MCKRLWPRVPLSSKTSVKSLQIPLFQPKILGCPLYENYGVLLRKLVFTKNSRFDNINIHAINNFGLDCNQITKLDLFPGVNYV